jgi:hypothetical protein
VAQGLSADPSQFHGYSTARASGARLGRKSIVRRGIAMRPRSGCFVSLGFLLSHAQVEWIKDACTKIGNICDVATYKRHRVHLCGRGK